MAEIRVPTLGESVTEATIGRWFKKAGDAVAVDEPLVELETDKVTIEVPAPFAGTLDEIIAKDGETVAVGALLGQISAGAGGAKPAAAPAKAAEAPKAAAPATAAPAPAQKSPPADAPQAPSVRKLSAESGIDA
ncbi:MAG: biotin/lipoyl-containing protein, partial [Afipia sp.]